MNNEENNDLDSCCFSCAYFYDVDLDGVGKCERAHGGITSGDNVCKCYLDIVDDLREYIEQEYDE